MGSGIDVQERAYKQLDDHDDLKVRVFIPNDGNSRRPAIVFYYGGGWKGGTWEQFRTHSEQLAAQGIVAITAQYRISSIHHTTPFECMEDAQDAFTWTIAHAAELGIDPARIAVGGGSAGGHLALCVGMLTPDAGTREQRGGIVPKAMVLFNPVCDTTGPRHEVPGRFGGRGRELSPIHHVARDQPISLLFHGTADTTVPYSGIVAFAEKMAACGNECIVVPYEGRTHGFFNVGRTENDAAYKDTLLRTCAFLQERL